MSSSPPCSKVVPYASSSLLFVPLAPRDKQVLVREVRGCRWRVRDLETISVDGEEKSSSRPFVSERRKLANIRIEIRVSVDFQVPR